MIDIGVLITGGIGILTTIMSGWVSWFFARKKYNTEVDSNIINNMKESLEFYKQLSDDNKKRLDETLKRSDQLEAEVQELRKQVLNLMTIMCTDLSCQLRKGDYNSVGKPKNKIDETTTDKNI